MSKLTKYRLPSLCTDDKAAVRSAQPHAGTCCVFKTCLAAWAASIVLKLLAYAIVGCPAQPTSRASRTLCTPVTVSQVAACPSSCCSSCGSRGRAWGCRPGRRGRPAARRAARRGRRGRAAAARGRDGPSARCTWASQSGGWGGQGLGQAVVVEVGDDIHVSRQGVCQVLRCRLVHGQTRAGDAFRGLTDHPCPLLTRSPASSPLPCPFPVLCRPVVNPPCPAARRYAPGDPIESWLHELLCLDAAQHLPKPPARLPHPSDCELFFVERDTLFSYHK